jgi:RNA polymerase sigma-70 factor, ECF subfamily
MMELLAPDVTAWTDGGGKIRAALRPLYGADHVARWILGVVLRHPLPDPAIHLVLVNGDPGVLATSAGVRDYVATLDLDHDNRIAAIRLIRNPDKLAHLETRLLATGTGMPAG